MTTPPDAKRVAGVWLPASEQHFADMILNHSKVGLVDGKGTYQVHKLRAALAHQPAARRRVALDIGAHVGLWAMWLVKEFAHVHAVEPVPAHADILPFNVAETNYTLHRVALGAAHGAVNITVPTHQTGGAHVKTARANPGAKYNVAGAVETWLGVPLRPLDSFGLGDVDFIKIDVEGYEQPVLEGARETILRCRPNIVIEQKGNEAAYGQPRDAALAYLRDLGMTPLRVISGDWVMGW